MPYQSDQQRRNEKSPSLEASPHPGTQGGLGAGICKTTGQARYPQTNVFCVMPTGRDGWSLTTERGHGDKISVVLITSVCNVIYP